MGTNPFDDFQPITPRHLDIRDDDAGYRIFLPVGIWTFAFQIFDGFFAIADNVHRTVEAIFSDGQFQQHHIIRIVFGD